ncbi:hypothetical protein V9K92_02035 [Phyllobacterium sp. CCNWLW109]|uniref:hypothetical protein n=1 Tax=Phyllobacterium sp. CCNWLW109 TaxID=3127479 RepID=UPI0030786108
MRIGSSRSRRPVASKIALPIAAATPTMATSPSPFTPASLSSGTGFVAAVASPIPASVAPGHAGQHHVASADRQVVTPGHEAMVQVHSWTFSYRIVLS